MTPVTLLSLLALVCAVPAVSGECPPEWMQFGDSCYFLNTQRLPQENASSYCKELNGTLAFPDTQEEQDFLWGVFLKHLAPFSASGWGPWIGCDDIETEGMWPCINLTTYVNWVPGEPNDQDRAENCLEQMPIWNGQWNDVPCHQPRVSLCEVRLSRPAARAVCKISSGTSLTATWCVLDGEVETSAVRRVVSCGKACRSDPKCRSFTARLGSDGVCELDDDNETD